MMNSYLNILVFPIILFTVSCQETGNDSYEELDWLINSNFIRQGCYNGKDCIPSLENPNRSEVNGSSLNFLDDTERIVGILDGEQAIAYPHSILDWHEIVNEDEYTISYCPLTGSALHLNSSREFGVSGLLYNSNLIMYDRKTDSYWPQLSLKSAAGKLQGTNLKLKPLIETSWGNWKKLFPDTKVINANTGHSRNYDQYPYGDYKTCSSNQCSDFLYFPLESLDDRLAAKDRVLGVIYSNEQKAYPIDKTSNPLIITDTIQGTPISVILSGVDDIAIAFETSKILSIETWSLATGEIILKDESGDQYSILGIGHDSAESLQIAPGFISYWFALATFYPTVEIET